jgi:predicted dehydrogenase
MKDGLAITCGGGCMIAKRFSRIAVIGFGYWGSKHVRVLGTVPGVDVTVVDPDLDRLADAVSHHPTVRTARSLAAVADDLDAVIIATPPSTHYALAAEALAAGLHVLVEKPLATSVVDAETLVDAAEAAGLTLMVGHTFEYNPAVRRLRDIVRSGVLGRILYIDAARLNLGLYQRDVNVIWDLAPHDVSIVNFLLGRLPSAVSAWGYSHANLGLEDVAHLQLRYTEPDIRAYIHVSWLAPCKVRRVTVVGSHKMAVYNDMSVDDRIRVYDTGLEDRFADSVDATPVAYRRGDIVSPFVPFVEPLAVQDAHLIDCIRTGSPPRTDGNSGLAVARVLEAANSALISGREVAIHTLPMLTDAEVVHAPDLTRYDTERPLVLDGDTA